ncbi:MAG: acyltransferase [Hydrogenothermaceae bacterium]|nr:acyltransferase [Hydrogenothermaceae bacterium]
MRGVDIFFVLSGYLITSIILHKINKHEFSLKEFYRNRARRLFPALILVLIFSLIVGYLFLFPPEYENLASHVKSSALYYQNYRLIGEVGYWDKEALLKPLLHIWSLSVEEQFYIVYPFLLLLLYKFKLLNMRTILLLFLISYGLSLYLSSTNNIRSFYDLASRYYELLFGGMLSFILFYNRDIIEKFIFQIKYIIYPLILILFITFYKINSYNPLKLLPLIFIVGLWILLTNFYKDKILSNKILIFFGLISYSLYLWHYVLLSFLHIFGYDNFIFFKIAILIFSVLISVITYKFIELPFRKINSYTITLLLFFTLIIISVIGQYIKLKDGLLNRPIVYASKEQLDQFKRDISEDINCNHITNSILKKKHEFYYCRSTTKYPEHIKYVLIGDSHAHVLYPGLNTALKKEGENLILLANSGCPPYIGGEMGRTLQELNNCKKSIDEIYKVIENLPKIDTVFISTRIAIYFSGIGFGEVEKGWTDNPAQFKQYYIENKNYNREEVFAESIDKTFRYFSLKKYRIVFILENPELGFDPSTCIARLFIPPGFNCRVEKKVYIDRQYKYREKVKEIAKRYNVIFIDPEPIFCDNKYCYMYKEGKSMYADDDHLSVFGSLTLGEVIHEKLFKTE